MKIYSLNKQNFGKIYATDDQLTEIQAKGYKLLNPIIDNYHILLSYQDVFESDTKHIFINEDNEVFVINEKNTVPLRIGKHSDYFLKNVKRALNWLYKEDNAKKIKVK